MQDPRLGRFPSPDPDEKKYPYQSTYAFAGNNPIQLIDLKGRGADDPQDGGDGCEDDCSGDNPPKSDPAKISAGYYGVNRTQIGGNTDLKLNTDFNYISPSSGSRFAPDEPSSFLHADFTFGDNNKNVDLSVGLFRNHTKGDFLLGNGNDVHFGVGNSQVGIGAGLDVSTPSFKGFTASASLFVGAGPQFSNFTSGTNTVSSSGWGVKGFGEVAVFGAHLNTPTIGSVFSLTLSVNATVHHASFSDFSVTNSSTGNTTNYSGTNFTTGGITPTVQLNFNLGGRR